jgi:hypothetical protein
MLSHQRVASQTIRNLSSHVEKAYLFSRTVANKIIYFKLRRKGLFVFANCREQDNLFQIWVFTRKPQSGHRTFLVFFTVGGRFFFQLHSLIQSQILFFRSKSEPDYLFNFRDCPQQLFQLIGGV